MTTRQGWVASRAHAPVFLAILGALALSACTSNSTDTTSTVTVSIGDDSCDLSAASAPAGHTVFSVTNAGSTVAEFYVYRADGTTIVGEVENIGPGLTRKLVATLSAGDFVTSCDPGMDGSDIRSPFTATADGTAAPQTDEQSEALAQASAQFLTYVKAEVDDLVVKTQAFADAFASGDDDAARALYTDARVHWERIEPVAESFGDLDPSLDLREADLGPQELWMGWHRAEKALWPPADGYPMSADDRSSLADQLTADTLDLKGRVNDPAFTIEAFQIGNGAKELLDEVATSKVTGEEEVWSGTDLWDIQANVDGAFAAYSALRPVVADKDADLVSQLDDRFAKLNALLATHGSLATGFTLYGDMSSSDVVELSRAVEALSEPLSRLTAAAVLG